jgi:lipid-A-disaccharide synthase-like uncharacterized protein
MNALWWAIGLTGQLAFGSRFLVQWVASEKARKSIVPIHFWRLSIIGSALLLTYAIHIKDPIFILGQSAGILIYARNLALIQGDARKRKTSA